MNDKQFRNRPFLVITAVRRPAADVNTSRKGWQNEPGALSIHENPSIVDHVSNKNMTEAHVIIDIMRAKLVKSRVTEVPAEQVVEHYLSSYKDIVSAGLERWIDKAAKKVAATMKPEATKVLDGDADGTETVSDAA